jgi:hypothetical protein
MRFLGQPFPKQIMLDQKQPKDMKYFNYTFLGRTVTNDAKWTRKIKSRIALAKAAIYKMKVLCTSKLGLNLR